MGIHFKRQKQKNRLVSAAYHLQKLLPLSRTKKFRLFLNLEWIFHRLSHEMSFKHYAIENHPFRTFSLKFVLDNIQKTDTVLDLGCKHGDLAFLLSQNVKEVTGVDYDASAIELAKQKYQGNNLFFIHAEAYEFLQRNVKSFDVLILSHILEHLENPEEFLMKFKMNFKHIYIEVPDFDSSYLNQYRKDFALPLIYSDNDHIWEFDREELRTLLDKSNISILKAEYRFGMQKLWCSVSG